MLARPAPTGAWLRRCGPILLVVTFFIGALPAQETGTPVERIAETGQTEEATLGESLFREQLFTNPAADYQGSCAGCHVSGGDLADRAPRDFADYTPLSLLPTGGTTLRNTPTLLDTWRAERFPLDGEYDSLEALIAAKLVGSEMGWAREQRRPAMDAIQFALQHTGEPEGSYRQTFERVYGASLDEVDASETVDLTARAIAAYLRTLGSTRTSLWDAFAEQNRLKEEPTSGQSADDYAFNIESRIGNQEGRRLIRRPEGFGPEAYEGFKLFFRVYADEGRSAGNCVACHTPPLFTDHGFHAVGTAQAGYERVHGEGAMTRWVPPDQPEPSTRAAPIPGDPARIDLGWWNFAPSSDRSAAFGAFKTPGLRNLDGSDPYFHDGSAATLEEAVAAKVELARRARAGEIRPVDPEVLEMVLSEEDIGPLVAFLRMLADVPPEDFRYYLIHFEENGAP